MGPSTWGAAGARPTRSPHHVTLWLAAWGPRLTSLPSLCPGAGKGPFVIEAQVAEASPAGKGQRVSLNVEEAVEASRLGKSPAGLCGAGGGTGEAGASGDGMVGTRL